MLYKSSLQNSKDKWSQLRNKLWLYFCNEVNIKHSNCLSNNQTDSASCEHFLLRCIIGPWLFVHWFIFELTIALIIKLAQIPSRLGRCFVMFDVDYWNIRWPQNRFYWQPQKYLLDTRNIFWKDFFSRRCTYSVESCSTWQSRKIHQKLIFFV